MCALRAPLDDEAADQVGQCVVEEVKSVIRQAYGGEAGHEVGVHLTLGEDRIELQICDCGNSRRDQDPSDSASVVEGSASSGHRSVMDEVRYEAGKDKNVLYLVKTLDTRAAKV
jgi:anti-sigma regulatory factor (Ser/Thr protein kinase)